MVAGIWFEMNRELPANYVLIQIQSERQIDLLSDTGTAVSWVAWYGIPAFHLYNCINDFSKWDLGAWFSPAAW